MAVIAFDRLPESARFWVFPIIRPLNEDESKLFLQKVDRFMQEWVSHQMEVTVTREWKYNQFLLVGADESEVGVSGCSNDSLFRTVKTIQQELKLDFPDTSLIYYKDGEKIQTVTRDQFRDFIKMGMVNENTIVFNMTLQKMGDYLKGLWETPMKNSWHIEAFPIPVQK